MTDATVDRLNAALEGRYAIERKLGEGGMAAVYLADDLKHERKVALKVLKPDLAAVVGAERFLAEIKVTANLQHPHILPLHDSGEADGFLFYVMPYVEGETLRDRIDREKQLPVDEAVRIATAVAGALQTAHEQGIIHRDIKPANILLSRGEPLISDFGIALAVGAAGGSRLTETGLSMGTPYYMSPEQATGDQHVGPSTDTYALGAVLYEMLTGDPPYMGSTAQAVLGQIIAGEALSATKKRGSVPANVDAALRCALEKLPADRFRSASGFAEALTNPGFRTSSAMRPDTARPGTPRRVASVAAALLTLGVGFGLGRTLGETENSVAKLMIPTSPLLRVGIGPAVAVSPDGSELVYVGVEAGGISAGLNRADPNRKLFRRRLADLEISAIPGTERAYVPTFSPDGGWVAFVADDKLWRVSLDGNRRIEIADVSAAEVRGISWSSADEIFYVPSGTAGLMKVSAAGGTPEVVIPLDTVGLRWPNVLPSGDAVMVTIWHGTVENAELGVVDVASRRLIPLGERGMGSVYAESGQVVYVRADRTLVAAPFDLQARTITGAPEPLEDSVSIFSGGASHFALSRQGTLAYWRLHQPLRSLLLVDRRGSVVRNIAMDTRFATDRPAISPDGTQYLVSRTGEVTDLDIWVGDLVQENLRPFEEQGDVRTGVWLGNDSIAFVSNRAGSPDWFVGAVDDGGPATRLFADDLDQWDGTWVPSTRTLLFGETRISSGYDISGFQLGSDSPFILLDEAGIDEWQPRISADGAWLAYASDEINGRSEIFVQRFPDLTSKRRVSTGGGDAPTWCPQRKELFYVSADSLVSVTYDDAEDFDILDRTVLFTSDLVSSVYDVHPDCETFIMLRDDEKERRDIVVVQNFFEELRERVGN